MVTFQLVSNARELKDRYEKRADRVGRAARIAPSQFAMAIHVIRKANLERMIYDKTPYSGTNKPTSRALILGERVTFDTAYNTSNHAKIRHDMRGTYSATGQSKRAEWVEVSVKQFRPTMILREQSMNRNILEGKSALVL